MLLWIIILTFILLEIVQKPISITKVSSVGILIKVNYIRINNTYNIKSEILLVKIAFEKWKLDKTILLIPEFNLAIIICKIA